MPQEFVIHPSPTRTSNRLDATVPGYKEGEWLPSVGGTATYAAQSGNWTKIGNRVFFDGVIAISAIGTGSTTVISGLPFTSVRATSLYVHASATLATAVVSICAGLQTSARTIVILSRTVASTQDFANDIFKDGTSLFVAGHYYTHEF